MTVDKELVALEEVAGVIDPGKCLTRIVTPEDPEKPWVWRARECVHVTPMIALAIWERMARGWIEWWCEKHEQEVEAFYRPNAEDGHTHIVRISRRAMPQAWLIRVQASGTSWAEILAAAVKKLDAMDEEGTQKGTTCKE